jgi:hypothetical protein
VNTARTHRQGEHRQLAIITAIIARAFGPWQLAERGSDEPRTRRRALRAGFPGGKFVIHVKQTLFAKPMG